jgi:hypothetical protein
MDSILMLLNPVAKLIWAACFSGCTHANQQNTRNIDDYLLAGFVSLIVSELFLIFGDGASPW